MTQQFRDQGGAASSDPSWLRRKITSLMMRRLADPLRRERARAVAESARLRSGEPHRVLYFHQPEDPYSHLAVQLLQPLCERYDIVLETRLCSAEPGANTPEPELLESYARRDCVQVAPHYGLVFPAAAVALDSALLAAARGILAAQPPAALHAAAPLIGAALWSADTAAMHALQQRFGVADQTRVASALEAGNAERRRLGHYAGAMFHYGGEWYWGVDRLYHLERRLVALGASREPQAPLLAARPAIELPREPDKGSLRLEFYASLRSPYTAVIYDRVIALARDSGVVLDLRPVLPMVMRGVPVTVQKGRYIFFDAAREAEELGLPPGRPRDPIGEPVRRLYSLLPWAMTLGRGAALLGAALQAAFRQGLDLGSDGGLRQVVESVGLSWSQARLQLGNRSYEQDFEHNRKALYEAGIWGVPAFRLVDAQDREILSAWGQDRLWLVAREIVRCRGL